MPLVPIALATGWSAAVLFALRIPLNPMSATLGALVIAHLDRVRRAARRALPRGARGRPRARRRRCAARTAPPGAAVLASGATAIAGFAVLAFSDVRMLQEFGIVTVVDLSVSLLGVLAVLPAVLVLAERGGRRAPAAPAGPASPTGPSRREGRLARRRGRRRRARLHHAQLAPDRGDRLAGPGARRRSCRRSPMPLAASARDGRRQRLPGARHRPGRRAAGLHGDRAGRAQRVRLAARRPVVLAFVVTRSGDCARQVDVLDRVAARFPDVAFAAVAVRERPRPAARADPRAAAGAFRSATTTTARSANLYGLGVVCPLDHVRGARRARGRRPRSDRSTRPSSRPRRAHSPRGGGRCHDRRPGPRRRGDRPARRRGAPRAAGLDRADRRAARADAAGAARAAAPASPTGCAARRRSRCAPSRCRGPTACSTAISGSTPT